jgi:hypothetical protein
VTTTVAPAVSDTTASGSPVSGWTAPGFEPVRAAFERNFTVGFELGAACAAYVDSGLVVDLWGGFRDHARREPWQTETIRIRSWFEPNVG